MAKKNKKRIIVIQKGKNKYAHEKMQGAGIKMYILERRIECEKIKEVSEGVSGPFRCYIIGDDMFCNGIKKTIADRKLQWQIITKFKNEDEVMKEEGVSFPAAVTEGVKTIKKKTSKIMEAVQELKGDDNPDIDDGDIAAVLMAADELKLLKIFPPTPENIYKAFVKTTDAYINDETSFGICTSIIYLYPPIYFAPVISSHSGNEFQINPSLASWMPRTLTKSF